VDRRAFLGSLTGGLLARPLAAGAQPAGKIARIGFLSPATASDPRMQGLVDAFRRGLGDLGHVEGRTFTIESRWADGRYDVGTLRQRNEFAPKLQYWFRSAQHWTDDLGSIPKNEKQR